MVRCHAVDDVERVGVVDGSGTTHANHRLGAGLAGGAGDVDTGSETLQGIFGAQLRLTLEVCGVDLGDGCRDDTLLLDTIADDDDVAEGLGIVMESDAHVSCCRQRLRLHTHVRHLYLGAGIDRDREMAVKVGDGSCGRSRDPDRGADDRLSIGIQDGAGEMLLLRP